MQIIVLGMHRSGTSLTTRLINMMGGYFGPEGIELGFDIDNPKGYWERKDVMRLNMALFKLWDTNWANVTNWPLPHTPRALPEPLLKEMKQLILNIDSHRPWVVKDPRFCLTLPYWQPLLEVPVHVIVHRDPHEIARSLEKRSNGSMSTARGVALWEFYSASLLNATQGHLNVYVSHAELVSDPITACARLYDDLTGQGVQGLRLPHPREIVAFVDARLNRSKPENTAPLSAYQSDIASLMTGTYKTAELLSISDESFELLQQPIQTNT